MQQIVKIHVKLLGKNGAKLLKGKDYKVKFYDKDPLKDDFLGESTINSNGHAIVSITADDYQSKGSPREKFPDIYFVVEKKGERIYKSPTYKNLHIEEVDDFSLSEGLNCDLGTFIIR